MTDTDATTTSANTETPAVTDEMIRAYESGFVDHHCGPGDCCVRAGLTAATADLRRKNAELSAVLALGYDVARAATERWKAEDPDRRKDVLFADASSL